MAESRGAKSLDELRRVGTAKVMRVLGCGRDHAYSVMRELGGTQAVGNRWSVPERKLIEYVGQLERGSHRWNSSNANAPTHGSAGATISTAPDDGESHAAPALRTTEPSNPDRPQKPSRETSSEVSLLEATLLRAQAKRSGKRSKRSRSRPS